MNHTAPTAVNWQEIDVYALPGKGIFRFDPHDLTLYPIIIGDLIEQAGTQKAFSYAFISNLLFLFLSILFVFGLFVYRT